MDATCAIQASIHVFSLVRKYVSRILGTYQRPFRASFVLSYLLILELGKDTCGFCIDHILRYVRVSRIPGLLKRDLICDGWAFERSCNGRVVNLNGGSQGAVIINPFGIAAYQADAACGTGDTHVVVGAGPYGHRICRIVDNGVDQDRKSCAKAGCVLGVNIMDHQSPAVFFRSLVFT